MLATARSQVAEYPTATLIEGEAQLSSIEFIDGRMSGVEALYLGPRTRLNSEVAHQLGCDMDEGRFGPVIRTDPQQMTRVGRRPVVTRSLPARAANPAMPLVIVTAPGLLTDGFALRWRSFGAFAP